MTEQKRHQGWGAIDELSPGEARVRVKALEAKLADLQQRAPWIPSTEQLASALESVPFYDHKSPELIAPDMRAALVTRMQSDAWDTWQVQGGHGWVITSCGNGDIIVSHESHGSASIAPNPTIPRIIPEALLRALSESLLAGERPTLIGVDLAASEAPAQPQAAPAPNPTPMVTTEMKQKFIGEFSWEEEAPYYDENGELHDHVAQHVVPWGLCKRIYKEMAGFALANGALATPVAPAAPDAALLAEALEKARETISAALKTGAPDWFKSDNDVSTHLTVKKIDAALAAYRCSTMSPAAGDVLVELQRRTSAAELSNLCEHLKQEAQIHAQEARTANGTIAEINQLVTGKTGEPGTWNGAEPVRKRIAELEGFAREIIRQYPNPSFTHEQFRVHACRHAETVMGQQSREDET